MMNLHATGHNGAMASNTQRFPKWINGKPRNVLFSNDHCLPKTYIYYNIAWAAFKRRLVASFFSIRNQLSSVLIFRKNIGATLPLFSWFFHKAALKNLWSVRTYETGPWNYERDSCTSGQEERLDQELVFAESQNAQCFQLYYKIKRRDHFLPSAVLTYFPEKEDITKCPPHQKSRFE